MGDVEELSYRLQLLDSHHKQFAKIYIYPLTIGKLCDRIQPGLPDRTSGMNSWFNDPALAPDWRMGYDGLNDQVKAMVGFMDDCTVGLAVQLMDQGPQMLGKHLALAAESAMSGEEKFAEPAAEYFSVMLGRALAAFNLTHAGANVLRRALGNGSVKPPEGAPNIKDWVEKFATIWGGMKEGVYERVRKIQYSFEITFEAIAVQLSNELVTGNQQIATWQDALEAGFRRGPNSSLLVGTVQLPLE